MKPINKWQRYFKSRGRKASVRDLIRLFLLREYHRLKKAGGGGRRTSAELLNRERYARNRVQRLRKRLLNSAQLNLPDLVLESGFVESPILDGILPNREQLWKNHLERHGTGVEDVNLEQFSFLDNPNATIRAFKKLAEVECTSAATRLHFHDPQCMDIGPYLVLGEVWDSVSVVLLGGHMEPPVQKVLEAVGLRKKMNVEFKAADTLENVWAFPLRQRMPFGPVRSLNPATEPQRESKVADELCDKIDEWLGVPKHPHKLSVQGRQRVATILLELLDNAKRHSDPVGKDGSWTVAAFMSRFKSGDDWVYRCYMAILSVGATIDESLTTASERVVKSLDEYANRHRRSNRSRATLRTVFALQDTITRDAVADKSKRGGFGFQEVFEMVDQLGGAGSAQHPPQLTVISGRSCVMVQQPYHIGQTDGQQHSPRTLWFNKENSPIIPPDPKFVFDLPEHFAGTIITIAFPLDPHNLVEKML